MAALLEIERLQRKRDKWESCLAQWGHVDGMAVYALQELLPTKAKLQLLGVPTGIVDPETYIDKVWLRRFRAGRFQRCS